MPPEPQPAAPRWLADLDHLADGFQRQHRQPFHTVSPDAFAAALRALRARLPSLADHEIVVEFARFAALIGDGHTALRPTDVPAFRRYPLILDRFGDGLFVRAVGRDHAAAAGARLLAIDDTPAWDAYDAVRPLISRDNEMGVWAVAPELLGIPEVLHARGVTAELERATFVVEPRGGGRTSLLLRPAPHWPADLADARDAAPAPTPLWLRRSPEENWFAFLPDTRALYLALNRVRDADEPLSVLFDRAFAEIDREGAERLVIDLRHNHGGDNRLNRPLVHHLIRCDRINRWGAIFVLIGRRTFSAAMNLAVDLERHTRALFVGEPTGSSPNHYGENADITLPHSRLRATASAFWWQSSEPNDDRPWIAPDLPARLTSDDYAANRDPALDAALRFEPGAAQFTDYPDRFAEKLRRPT